MPNEKTYAVRTMHGDNEIIVPVDITATGYKHAAQARFNRLAPFERAGCRALLVSSGSKHRLFAVATVTVPALQYKIVAA